MSTRSCIARLTSKEGKKIKFTGVYHHWDGYPDALGSTLFQLRNGHFKGDTNAMLTVLIDLHPAGWSTINGADFNIPAGYIENTPYKSEMNEQEKLAYDLYNKKPKCFCHGDRHEEGSEVNQKNASECGCEYVYAFTPDGKTMVVLSSYTEKGTKMIGMFGSGDPNAEWKVIGEIKLDGLEPTEEQWGTIPIVQSVVIKHEPLTEESQKEIESVSELLG